MSQFLDDAEDQVEEAFGLWMDLRESGCSQEAIANAKAEYDRLVAALPQAYALKGQTP